MAKANTYKLKDGVTKEDLIEVGFKEDEFEKRYRNYDYVYIYKNINRSITMQIEIEISPILFDDFKSITLLDVQFCQPYTPFYGDNYKKEITGFKFLEDTIEGYNRIMDEMSVFEKVEEQKDVGNEKFQTFFAYSVDMCLFHKNGI